jgi:PAS domain S-box-containing protein
MRAPATPSNELKRLADLYEYGILDTAAEKIFDEVAELAAEICGTRFAGITLVDKDRQWFKAEFGLTIGETSRDESVCGHAILETDVFEVTDTDRDERFAGNPVLDGSPRIRYYGGSQLNSRNGNAIGMLCVMDSEPRELSAQQRKSLKQLADVLMAVLEAGRETRLLSWLGTLLDTISEEIFIGDPRTLRYLYANASALRSLGLTLDQMRTMTPMDVTQDTDRQKFEGYVRQLQAGTPFVIFEGVRKRSNGQTYPVEVRWQLITTRGRPVLLSQVHDIAERKEVDRLKDEFISVVNHELRTPLTSIHGAVKLLEQGAGGTLPAPAMRLVELAAQNTARLRTIVDDILDLEKITSGRMPYQMEPLDTRELLERAAVSLEPTARAAGVSVEVEAPGGTRVMADSQRAHQVLANLLSNAVKYAPAGSAVRLVAACVAGAKVRIEVIDSGPGIPPHFRERIFQRFAQADMNTSRGKGGSGLGLSIARQMTEQMQGEIGYESQPGRTTFHITLREASV